MVPELTTLIPGVASRDGTTSGAADLVLPTITLSFERIIRMTDALSAIPPDDLQRTLTVSDPESGHVPHISLAGGTYTVLVSGE